MISHQFQRSNHWDSYVYPESTLNWKNATTAIWVYIFWMYLIVLYIYMYIAYYITYYILFRLYVFHVYIYTYKYNYILESLVVLFGFLQERFLMYMYCMCMLNDVGHSRGTYACFKLRRPGSLWRRWREGLAEAFSEGREDFVEVWGVTTRTFGSHFQLVWFSCVD